MNIATRTNNSSASQSDLADKAARLREQFEELMECYTEEAGEKIESLKNRAADLYERGSEKAAAVTKQTIEKAVETVKKYPWQTACVAVGTGLLTWWLLSRRGGTEEEEE